MSTSAESNQLIAVFGATGQQGGAVVRALQARGQFRVRALSRNADRHRGMGDEVVEANLDQPDTLKAALQGVHGVFAVTNFWSEGTDERETFSEREEEDFLLIYGPRKVRKAIEGRRKAR